MCCWKPCIQVSDLVLAGGRGRRGAQTGGRGGRGGRGTDKPKSKEQLDAEMDDYFLKDHKHAQTKLNADLDSYFKEKGKKPAAENGEQGAEEQAET